LQGGTDNNKISNTDKVLAQVCTRLGITLVTHLQIPAHATPSLGQDPEKSLSGNVVSAIY
jgi:hypothetical protein